MDGLIIPIAAESDKCMPGFATLANQWLVKVISVHSLRSNKHDEKIEKQE